MDKEAGPNNPFNLYQKHIGRQPVLDTAASGAAGTALGYMGANVLLNPLLGLVAGITKADPAKVRRIQQAIKAYGGMAGGAAGLAYGAGKHMDTSRGLRGMVNSMTDSGYWSKNPGAASRRLNAYLKNIQTGKTSIKTPDLFGIVNKTLGVPTQKDVEMFDLQGREMERVKRKQLLEEARSGLPKEQSLTEDPLADKGHLPMDYAMSVIARDPFLSMGQKVVTGGIMADSGDATDAGGLMKAALRFGAAAAPAYLFGRGVANIMGLAPEKVKTLSSVGGVAAGILNTGIFGE